MADASTPPPAPAASPNPSVPGCRSRGLRAPALVGLLVIIAFLLASFVRHKPGSSYGFPLRCVSAEWPFVYAVEFIKRTPDGRTVRLFEGEEYLDTYERQFGFRPRPTWKVNFAALAGNVLIMVAVAAGAMSLCWIVQRRLRRGG